MTEDDPTGPSPRERPAAGWVMMMHLCRMRAGFLLRVTHPYVEIKRLKGIWWMPWH